MTRVYFTDRDLGKQFPAILRAAGVRVERHGDHFAPETADEAWLQAVSRNEWVVVTHDGRIRYKINERDAVMRNGLAMLVVVGKAPYPDLARAFIETLPKIERFLDRHAPPFIAKVHRASPADRKRNPNATGQVDMHLSMRQWADGNGRSA